MDGTLLTDAEEMEVVGPSNETDDFPRPKRRRIDTTERRVLDNKLADRLEGLGIDPWLPDVTTLTVMQTGQTTKFRQPVEKTSFAGRWMR